ncbi:MAG: SDR family oxidoreductase [Dehalococcoidales bacterium]|nr:SDR family oxidoreductase [Dehalococcoidales bacterium]
MDRVKDKVAIVTGSASGIGKAAALLLAEEGAFVAITDIADEAGELTVEEIKAAGGKAGYWHMNVADESEVEKVFGEINAEYGKINILVNNAGIPGPPKETHELTAEEFDKVININLRGVFFCTKHVLGYMKQAGVGSIVNMSSMLGLIGGEDPAYHASKGGVRLMTKSDATTYGPYNIRVNSVHPGYILTPLFRGIAARSPKGADKFMEDMAENIPLKRLGTPEDIAKCVLFIASDESSYITGTEFILDGGFILQ